MGQSGHEEWGGQGDRDRLGVSAELGGETSPLGAEPEFVRAVDGLGVEGETAVELPRVPEIPKGRRAAAAFIFLTVTLDMLALGMIAPVLPRLITGFLHGNTVNAAQMLGVFGTVFA
ncbi:MAG TPA: hypothetical protein VH250_03665, partial [Granulicella sp.]|nr:hypothetical protein [Granulicella sp.]